MNFLIGKKTLTLAKTKYHNDRIAIVVIDSKAEPYARLTVNLPDEHLEPDEIFVRQLDSNQEIIPPILRLGIFEETTMSVKNGHAMIPIWRIADARAFESIPDIKDAVKSIIAAARSTRR